MTSAVYGKKAVHGNPAARSKRRDRARGRGLMLALCAAAGTAVWFATMIATVRTAAPTLVDGGTMRIEASLGLKPVRRDLPEERTIAVSKFSRLSPPTTDELRQARLTPDAIRLSHQRGVAIASLNRVQDTLESAYAVAVATVTAEAGRIVAREPQAGGQSLLLTALVENVSAREDTLGRAFDLVLSNPDAGLPEIIPLPESRPALVAETVVEKPLTVKPGRETQERGTRELAYAKPDRSLFDGLLGRGEGGAHGRGTKVAIYDVAAATVHMPDGTKLRAHSGIGSMRDNPKFSHVKMKGATPAGIYRLTMREKRFHGVEALRMTSIDGRHPKNRTGLLTHTNLLRGQIGSHGCVAFQNYEPFLRAFKRGHINMLVVVDRMPTSQNQIAAIYRKAGA